MNIEHDELCPDAKHPHYGDATSCVYCQCYLINKVRESERERMRATV